MTRTAVFRLHAVKRMFERQIKNSEVLEIIEKGHLIEDYPEDEPYPSCLKMGKIGERTLHVVVADNQKDSTWIVITVYEPNPEFWEPGFEKRKTK